MAQCGPSGSHPFPGSCLRAEYPDLERDLASCGMVRVRGVPSSASLWETATCDLLIERIGGAIVVYVEGRLGLQRLQTGFAESASEALDLASRLLLDGFLERDEPAERFWRFAGMEWCVAIHVALRDQFDYHGLDVTRLAARMRGADVPLTDLLCGAPGFRQTSGRIVFDPCQQPDEEWASGLREAWKARRAGVRPTSTG